MSFAVRSRQGVRAWLTAFAFVASAAVVPAQTATTVTGRITAQESNEPLSDVRVLVVGTTVFAISNPEGRYTL